MLVINTVIGYCLNMLPVGNGITLLERLISCQVQKLIDSTITDTQLSHTLSRKATRCAAYPLDLAPVFWCVPVPRNHFHRTAAGLRHKKPGKKIQRESEFTWSPPRRRVCWGLLRCPTSMQLPNQEKYLTRSLIIIPKWSLCEGMHLSVINYRQ